MKKFFGGLSSLFVAILIIFGLLYSNMGEVYAVSAPEKCTVKTNDNKTYVDNSQECVTWRKILVLNISTCETALQDLGGLNSVINKAILDKCEEIRDAAAKAKKSVVAQNAPTLEECRSTSAISKTPECQAIIAKANADDNARAKAKQDNIKKTQALRKCMTEKLDKYIEDNGYDKSKKNAYLNDIRSIKDDGNWPNFDGLRMDMHLAKLFKDCGGAITEKQLDDYTKQISQITDNTQPSETSCNIDKVGWIVCPTLSTTAQFVSGIYEYIAKNFLEVKSNLLFGGANEGASKSVYDVWVSFRDIANVLFVIMFTLVIISQTTNIGISNYGIKKMLPRLIIFAILINISYWISVIAVDASNIIGKSIYNMIVGIAGQNSDISASWASGSELTGLVTTALAGGAAIAAAGGIGMALVAVVIAFLVMAVTLTVRQAVIILLVIVSPIAFASAILPQTEDTFKKWKNLLKGMLITYPAASMLMAGCILASNVLSSTFNTEEESLQRVMFSLLPMVGMVGVIAVIKGALAAVDKLTGGSISKSLGRIEGAANKVGGAVDKRIGQTRAMQAIKHNPVSRRFARSNAMVEARNARNREAAILGDYRKKGYAKLSPDEQRHMSSLESKFAKESSQEIENAAMSNIRSFGVDEAEYAKLLESSLKSDADNKNSDGTALATSIETVMKSNLSGGAKTRLVKNMMEKASQEQLQSVGVQKALNMSRSNIDKIREKDFITAQTMINAASGDAKTREQVAQDEKTYLGVSGSVYASQSGDTLAEIKDRKDGVNGYAQLSSTVTNDMENKVDTVLSGNNKDNISELTNFEKLGSGSVSPTVSSRQPASQSAAGSSTNTVQSDPMLSTQPTSTGPAARRFRSGSGGSGYRPPRRP